MKQRKNSGIFGKVLLIIFCAVLLIAIIWGIGQAVIKIKQYAENTSISAENTEHDDSEAESALPAENVLPRNTYKSSGFYEENGIRFYKAEGMIGRAGIDISAFQPSVDWVQVKEAGIEFVMLRLGYRGYATGELDLDDCFLKHIDGALEAGLDVGIYFFSQALTPEEAVEEAEYVITWLEGYDISYPVAFDWEEVDVPARTDNMNMLNLTACAEAFCRTVEEAGYEASVYFNQAYGYEQLNLVSIRDYGFWLAEYAESPTFAYDFAMWQYTNEGSVPGIEGPVDLNICFEATE